jgi:hypothetical protein
VSRCTAEDIPPRSARAEITGPPRRAAAQSSACLGGRERSSRLVSSSSQNPCAAAEGGEVVGLSGGEHEGFEQLPK